MRPLFHLLLAAAAAVALRAETIPAPAETPPVAPPEDPRVVARREAWTSVVLIISLLEQGDPANLPGIRAWLADFRQVAATLPPVEAGRPFPPLDAGALVTRNPHFWMAFYEVQPGDPGFALLHGALLLSGGEAQRASTIAALGLQRPGIPAEIKRGLLSIIAHGQTAQAHSMAFVREGMKLHDRRDYTGAIGFYDRAIEEWPANGAAHAERGLSFRARAVSAAREAASAAGPDAIFAPADPPETADSFATARRHDPFNLLAYQGDEPALLAGLMALVQDGLPVWEEIRKKPEQPVKTDQLRRLSEACRVAAIDDFALVTRQLVVAGNRRYHPEDETLISECLRRLAPPALTPGVIARIGGETRVPTRQIVVPLPVDPPQVAQTTPGDAEEKPEPEAPAASKAKAGSGGKSSGKTAASSSKKGGGTSSKKGTTSSSSGKKGGSKAAGSRAKGKSGGGTRTAATSKSKGKSKKRG